MLRAKDGRGVCCGWWMASLLQCVTREGWTLYAAFFFFLPVQHLEDLRVVLQQTGKKKLFFFSQAPLSNWYRWHTGLTEKENEKVQGSRAECRADCAARQCPHQSCFKTWWTSINCEANKEESKKRKKAYFHESQTAFFFFLSVCVCYISFFFFHSRLCAFFFFPRFSFHFLVVQKCIRCFLFIFFPPIFLSWCSLFFPFFFSLAST